MEYDEKKIKELQVHTILCLTQKFSIHNYVNLSIYGYGQTSGVYLKKNNIIKYMILIGDKEVDLKHVVEATGGLKDWMTKLPKLEIAEMINRDYSIEFSKNEIKYTTKEDMIDMYLILQHYVTQ